MTVLTAKSCAYCFLDVDIDNHRSKLAVAASFVDATNSRYGYSSKDLRTLGGSELSRIEDMVSTDHEWAAKNNECGGVNIRPPRCGNRIVVRLFWDVAPLACENFATLCANGGVMPGTKNQKPKPPPLGESGKPLSYRNSVVHRIVPGFVFQGGDFVFGNGSGGESIYNGKKFKDERAGLSLKHDRMGVLSMGNSGKNSNTSQFFITFKAAPQCDGQHVVFGEVVSGFEVLRAAEQVGTASGEPRAPVVITDCGIFAPLAMPGAGYWYDQPDSKSYCGFSSVFMVRPRVVVLAPTRTAMLKFEGAIGTSVVLTLLAIEDEQNQDVMRQKAVKMLESFAAEVLIFAPACSHVLNSVELPARWAEIECGGNLVVEDVVIAAKPVEALEAIRYKSWIGKRTAWQLDGVPVC